MIALEEARHLGLHRITAWRSCGEHKRFGGKMIPWLDYCAETARELVFADVVARRRKPSDGSQNIYGPEVTGEPWEVLGSWPPVADLEVAVCTPTKAVRAPTEEPAVMPLSGP